MRKMLFLPALIIVAAIVLAGTALALRQEGGAPVDTETPNREIALDFVRNEATFKFDGMEETLNVSSIIPTNGGIVPGNSGWEVTVEFQSRHAGYGDRTGKILAQVITPHHAVVTVEAENVTSAVMDGRWDMMNQTIIGN